MSSYYIRVLILRIVFSMCPHTTISEPVLPSLSLPRLVHLLPVSGGQGGSEREEEEEEGSEAKREEKERGREEVRGVIYRE